MVAADSRIPEQNILPQSRRKVTRVRSAAVITRGLDGNRVLEPSSLLGSALKIHRGRLSGFRQSRFGKTHLVEVQKWRAEATCPGWGFETTVDPVAPTL